MKESEYVRRVATMLYNYNIHRIIVDKNSEFIADLPKLTHNKKFKDIYRIFSGCSTIKTSSKILQNVRNQLGISSGENLDYLLSFNKEETLNWFGERHEKYKTLHCGSYWILSRYTKHAYFGSSLLAERRLAHHRNLLRRFQHPNQKLQDLWTEHGELSFTFKVLELTTDFKTSERDLIIKYRDHFSLLNSQEQKNQKPCQRFFWECL